MLFRRAYLAPLLVIAATLLAGCANPQFVTSPPGTTTTLILLRHAERPAFVDALDAEGRARAAALPAALEGVHIDAIYSPDRKRNLATVAALAKQRGLTVKVIEVSRVAPRLIRENPGKTVMWVGNSGNLEGIYEDVGGRGPPPIQYGDLYIVRVPDKGPPEVIRTRYGR